ncbi:MAG: F-box protein [Kistimonas sp.]|nr:F-box protein [Kistimonas sp.]
MSLPVTPAPGVPSGAPETQTPQLATAFARQVAPGPDGPAATEPSRVLQLPGRDIARWPCSLLELVLCHLELADLTRAGQTCRRWHEAASRYNLQASSFIQSLLPYHRHQLEAALDVQLGKRILSLWFSKLPADYARPEELAWLSGPPPPWHSLFYALTRQMLRSRQLCFENANACIRSVSSLACLSPDGNYCVTAHNSTDTLHAGPVDSLSVWQLGTRDIQLLDSCLPVNNLAHRALCFSADSRRFLAMNDRGLLRTWQRQADASWQLCAVRQLCHGSVLRAQWSPDTRHLALRVHAGVVHAGILVFDETAPQVWQEQYRLYWERDLLPDELFQSHSHTMHFSTDSRRFLLLAPSTAVILDRRDARWHAQTLPYDARADAYERASLSPSGDWLAIVYGGEGLRQLMCDSYTLRLWQYRDTGRSWQLVWQSPFAGTGFGCPLAFSPDEKQLAATDRLENGNACVTVLTLPRPDEDMHRVKLQVGPGIAGPRLSSGAIQVSFSSHGRYLVAAVGSGVQFWQRQGASWEPAIWIDNGNERPAAMPSVALSPDGFHCAVHTGRADSFAVYGPGREGLLQKMEVTMEGLMVTQMLFTSDGTRLLVSGENRDHFCYYVSLVQLVPTANTAPHQRAATREPAARGQRR